MQAPSETEVESSSGGRSRRRFLQSVGLIGGVAISGCSGTFSSSFPNQSEDRNTTTSSPSERSSSTTTPSSIGSGGVLSGIYNGDHPLKLRVLDKWLGYKPAVAVLFVDALADESWISTLVESHMTRIWKHGHVPMLVWQPFNSSRRQAPENIETRIANGAFDDTVETWATHLESWVRHSSNRNHWRRFYFLLAEEMNGDWYPWGAVNTHNGKSSTKKTGVPDDYVRMWTRIYKIFSNTSMDESTTQWVWVPNADQVGGVRTERYYPGDDYVDWIGLNGYNYGDINHDSRWQTPKERFGDMLQRMKNLATKPLCLPEVSTTSYVDGAFRPRRKARWIERLFSFVDEENIKMVCWFNFDDTGEWDSDWAVFGGAHGTSTVQVTDKTYHVYDAYKREINAPSAVNARTDHPRILTDDEFTGRL